MRGKRDARRRERESLFDKLDITKYQVKTLIAIPLIILLLAFVVIGYTYVQPPAYPHSPYRHAPVQLGMDFIGGTMVKIQTEETHEELTVKFSDFPLALVGETGSGAEKRIDFGPMSDRQRDELIDKLNGAYGAGSYELANISPVFGEQYLTQALWALLAAFSAMAIVVFAVFRMVIPPSAVIFAAFSDIVIALACMNLIGMKLSLGTVAALLMLIGYSVDSNILLTTNLLRKKGDLNEKLRDTMKTGIMMTSTTLTAVVAMLLVSYYIDIIILKAIAIVLVFGLVMDLMNTWLLNAGILRWYIEKRDKKKFVLRNRKKNVAKVKANKKA